MSDTKWTPGPWEFVDPGPHGEFQVHWSDVDADDDGRAVDHGHTVCTVHDVTEDSGEANARLIASAPDLYAALAAVIGDYEAHMRPHDYVTAPLLNARAALSKARGDI